MRERKKKEMLNDSLFQVDRALIAAKKVLHVAKNPSINSSSHVYEDKYLLAESMGNATLGAFLNVLELLGVNARSIRDIRNWAKNRSVTLRLKASETCVFDRMTKREVESTSHVRDYGVGKITDKVVTTITEWFWNYTLDYSLVVFVGNEGDEKVILQERVGKIQLMTTTEKSPLPESVVRDALDLNISYLFSKETPDGKLCFGIVREARDCHTPRRNPEVDELIRFVVSARVWANRVREYFRNSIFPIETRERSHVFNFGMLDALDRVFVPIVPLFDSAQAEQWHEANALIPLAEPANPGQVLKLADLNSFLDEQKRTLSEKFSDLAKGFPDRGHLVTVAEAQIVVLCSHIEAISNHFIDGVNYIEDMIRKLMIKALGRELSSVDFYNYMRFHNQKVFREEYQPKPFCYAVRRPDYYPEGILTVYGQLANGLMADPIETIVSRSPQANPMHFAISASAKVAFKGDVFLHGYVGHSFQDEPEVSLSLSARARQFSSFLVLVGRIAGPGLFDPQFGMIVQNKDEFSIPLELETIPTPKEFRDAIESLSPEQQQFAKLFRGMQLASTLFGVCVLQIKPQLEKILRLNNESLTKEIRLTQDLLDLFIQYQIPSDLLSFGGPEESKKAVKIQGVKDNVAGIFDMIKKAKQKEIDEAAQVAQVAIAQSIQPPVQRERLSVKSAAGGGGGGGGRVASPRSAVAFNAPVARSAVAMASPPPPPSSAPAPVAAPAPAASVPAPAPPAAQVDAPAPAQSDQKLSTKFDSGSSSTGVDFTKIPTELDSKFERLDSDSALRPTILKVGQVWSKTSQSGLLSPLKEEGLNVAKQKLERQNCFDLLDALTKSGCIGFDDASLHIVMASTHCFTKNVMNTLVQDNINPIEKLERSELIVATTIHRKPAQELLRPGEADRAKLHAPQVFAIEDK